MPIAQVKPEPGRDLFLDEDPKVKGWYKLFIPKEIAGGDMNLIVLISPERADQFRAVLWNLSAGERLDKYTSNERPLAEQRESELKTKRS